MKPTEFFPQSLAKATSYLKAEASQILLGKVDDTKYNARIAECRKCEHLKETEEDEIGFCGRCGCGTNPRARLTVKARMPKATCPLSKWREQKETSDG